MDKAYWVDYWDRIVAMAKGFDFHYILEFLVLVATFYLVFNVLKENKCGKVIVAFVLVVLFLGLAVTLDKTMDSFVILFIIALLDVLVLMLFNTEIKRSLLGTGNKKHVKKEADSTSVRNIESIIDEVIRAVQHMSKNDIGALIVLSKGNLPEGIVSSGTIINAEINSPMIEAVFYPKAPLHDGAMIIEGEKIHAAGCFLPLIENNNLPQEVGSRHRAALGVTTVAAVTAIVVSEETGIISIMKNGEVKKRYAGDADLKNELSNYYWTDLTGKESE